MNNIYWNGLRSFLAVVEHGSFTQASDATGLSKASLSQQVSQLESQLGVQLLYRTTRKVRLTSVGQDYYSLCRSGVKILSDASMIAEEAREKISGRVRVNSVGGIIGEEVIAPLIIAFRREHPQVDVKLDFSSIREDLLESQYDLVLRMGALDDSSLKARRIHTLRTRYVAAPDLLADLPVITHPRHLAGLPLIYGSVGEWTLRRDAESVKVQASEGFQIANGRVMVQAAIAGLGIARLADIYTDAAIKQGALVEVLPDWQETTPLWLVSPPTRHQLRRVKALGDWIAQRFAGVYGRVKDTL